jgi:hypothetical protein
MPPRLKKPPPVVAAGAPIPGLPGWLKVRLNGWAVLGAVDVLGGAAKVRDPRDPELIPPPTRASAAETAIASGSATDRTTAIARTIPRVRCVKFIFVSLNSPAWGKRHLDGQAYPKVKR